MPTFFAFFMRWIFGFIFYRIEQKMRKKSYGKEGRSLMDFSVDLLSRRRKFIVSLFCCAHDTCVGIFCIFCTHDDVQCVRQFSHRKCGLNSFKFVCTHFTLLLQSSFSFIVRNSHTTGCSTCWMISKIPSSHPSNQAIMQFIVV